MAAPRDSFKRNRRAHDERRAFLDAEFAPRRLLAYIEALEQAPSRKGATVTESIHLLSSPLTAEGYAGYGDVIMVSPRGEAGKPANQGTARRYDHLAALDNRRPDGARLNVSAFRCEPRPKGPFTIEILEKHPLSTQIFVPMRAKRFFVVVALGGDRPDVSTLAAFEARGPQGVTYRPGVWHHPMIAVDEPTDFACFVFEDGTSEDCEVVSLSDTERRILSV